MIATKCDICKKYIKRTGEEISIYVGVFSSRFDICDSCAKPIIKFLKSEKLIKKDEKRGK